MNNFMKQLEESGIKDSLMKALEKNPCADIAEILEYEISKDENLEDAFLSDAHELAMDCVCSDIMQEFLTKKILNPEKVEELGEALGQVVEKIIDAFGSVFNAQKNDKE